jgi:hypothetical protein
VKQTRKNTATASSDVCAHTQQGDKETTRKEGKEEPGRVVEFLSWPA